MNPELAMQREKLLASPMMEPAAAPSFTKELRNIPIKIGTPLKLECEVTGSPVPEVNWMRNGHPIEPTHK